MNLAYALSKGVESAAGAASGLLDEDRKLQQQIDAETRAADLKLSTDQRLLAIREAADQRAREAMATRLKTGRDTILDKKVGAQFDAATDAYANSNLTDEEKKAAYAEIEKNRGNARANVSESQKMEAYIQAGQESGDIDPKTSATLYRTQRAEEARAATTAMIEAGKDKRNLDSIESREAMAEQRFGVMMARIAESGKKGGDSKKDDPYKMIQDLRGEQKMNQESINRLRADVRAARKDGDDDLVSDLNGQIKKLEGMNTKLSKAKREVATMHDLKLPSSLMDDDKEETPAAPKVDPAKRPPLSSFKK